MTQEHKRKQQELLVESQMLDLMKQDYEARVQKYKNLYPDMDWTIQHVKEGPLLRFPSQQEAASYAQEQAEKNREFLLVSQKTGKVVAFSKGDGKLYHGNGEPYEDGPFKASDQQLKDFQMPEESRSFRM